MNVLMIEFQYTHYAPHIKLTRFTTRQEFRWLDMLFVK